MVKYHQNHHLIPPVLDDHSPPSVEWVRIEGMKNANKHVLMSALSYNLKKFLK